MIVRHGPGEDPWMTTCGLDDREAVVHWADRPADVTCPNCLPTPPLVSDDGTSRRRMTVEEAEALLVLVRGGWLKLELALADGAA